LTDARYGSLTNVQVMAGVSVVDGVSAADVELSLYLDKAAQFIDDTLKGVGSKSLFLSITLL